MTFGQHPPPEYVQAAQATISAAAAALVWSTADPHGVLAHVAGADPALMAATRRAYEHQAAHLGTATVHGLRGFADLRDSYRTTDTLFEVAALPWTVAPDWRGRICAALSSPIRPGPYDPAASAARSVANCAIHVCRHWGEEQLNFDRIAFWAGEVSRSADRCWQTQNIKR